MINGKQTDFVYLSKLIHTIEHYSSFWAELIAIFETENIEYGFLDETEDIWVKEYMPIQSKKNEFVQFTFFPEQGTTDNHEPSRTNPLKVLNTLNLGNVITSDLIINGRDLVYFDKKIIVSDKILHNNFIKEKKKLFDKINESVEVKEISIIPLPRKGDVWHIDCLVKLLNDNTLLVSDTSRIKKSWVKDFEKALHESNKLLMTFPSALEPVGANGNHIYSTKGCYLNYVQIGNKIIFPIYDIPEDELALKEVAKLHPFCKVIPINCNTLANEGAGLNSIMWTIQK